MIDPSDSDELRSALMRSPTARQVAKVVDEREGVFVVGGAVRDLFLGHEPLELDLVVEGDAIPLAHEIADSLSGSVTSHERFMTASVDAEAGSVDLASAREESYPAPGALPDVTPAGLATDLERRDFTVNAIAVAFDGTVAMAHPLALDDLREGVLRVLHERSFIDDPTRLWRLARYCARLGFEPDPSTQRLASEAVTTGALSTLGADRKGGEFMRTLGDPAAASALDRLAEMGLLEDIGATGWDREAALQCVSLLGAGAPSQRLFVASCFSGSQASDGDLTALGMGREMVTLAVAARQLPFLEAELSRELRPSEIHSLLEGSEPEVAALAGAGEARGNVELWLGGLSRVRPLLDGRDVIEAGVPQGPAVAVALKAALAAQLDLSVEDRSQLIEIARQANLAA